MTPNTLALWLSAIFRHGVLPCLGAGLIVYSTLAGELDATRVGLAVGLITGGIVSSTPVSIPESSADTSPSAPELDTSSSRSPKTRKR